MPRPWIPLATAALGFALGLADLVALRSIGVSMQMEGHDVTVPVMMLYAATFAALGGAIGWIAVARGKADADAATIRRQLAALQASADQLLQYEKLASLGRMAAGIAHEVRNPLGVIRSAAALIAEGLPDGSDELARASSFILEEVDRLNRFVARVLDFSRPLAADRRSVPVATAVDRARDLAAPLLSGVQVAVPAAAGSVDADPDLLVQVLVGLLANAGEAGARRIAIDVERCDDRVHIDIGDDGPGVVAEDRDRLFEPFFSRKASGTGLGLSMAHRIAQAHGGSVAYRPHRALGGACFRISLPVAP